MPQKPLLKPGKKIEKKKPAANKHGKGSTTRKGHFEKPPKKGIEAERYKENKELTKVINSQNETNFASIARNKGGMLKTLKTGPPALNSKDKQARAKAAKAAAQKGDDDDDDVDAESEDEDMEEGSQELDA